MGVNEKQVIGLFDLQILDFLSQVFLRFPQFLLEPSEQFIVFSVREREVVIGQLPVFLFQFTLCFVPTAFEL